MNSQTSSTPTKKLVRTLIDSKGDTLVEMKLSDARFILSIVLDKDITDSIIRNYEVTDSLNKERISLQVNKIRSLQELSDNKDLMSTNLNKIISNKDEEIVLLNDVIKEQKKEIRKQKFLKIIGFISAVVLPITVILFLGK